MYLTNNPEKALQTNQPLTTHQQAVVTLWHIVNMSLTSYAKLLTYFHSPEQALTSSLSSWQSLNLHSGHIQRFHDYIQAGRHSQFLLQTQQHIQQGDYQIVFYDDVLYPINLKHIFDPPPLLFYQGNLQALTMPQLAIVGSRKPTHHAQKIAFDMAQYLAYEGMWITSGMADGIDKQAHLGALSQTDVAKQGRTIAVLGTGICQCYPKYHQNLRQQIIDAGGCVISELLPDIPASSHNFPRRNRLVAGLSLATLVVESALKSGSLITARLTNEQGKQVFAIPSHIDNEQAKGCHQLIREGATLVDHPIQILEDLAVVKSSMCYQSSREKQSEHIMVENNVTIVDNQEIPAYLLPLLNQLDWVGQDMDRLIEKTQTDIATLTGWLMELELLGKATQHGGLYMRCR